MKYFEFLHVGAFVMDRKRIKEGRFYFEADNIEATRENPIASFSLLDTLDFGADKKDAPQTAFTRKNVGMTKLALPIPLLAPGVYVAREKMSDKILWEYFKPTKEMPPAYSGIAMMWLLPDLRAMFGATAFVVSPREYYIPAEAVSPVHMLLDDKHDPN